MVEGRRARVDCCNGEDGADYLARRAAAEEADWLKTLPDAVRKTVAVRVLHKMVRSPQWAVAKLTEQIKGMCRTHGVWRTREDATIGQMHGAEVDSP